MIESGETVTRKRASAADVLAKPRRNKCRHCDGRGYTEGLKGVFTCTECDGAGESLGFCAPPEGGAPPKGAAE